jgi:hypothetical protein
MSAIYAYALTFIVVYWCIKMETGRSHLGGSVAHSKGKSGESVVTILMFLCGSPRSWASIERTNHMLVIMGPVSLVVGCQQKLDFSSLLHWLLWERSCVWTHESVSYRAIDCVGSPFSQRQWIYSNLLTTARKVTTYGDRLQEAYAGYIWTGVGSVRVVLIGFSPTGCTSIQIVTTLEYK